MKYTEGMNISVVNKKGLFFLVILTGITALAFSVHAADPTGNPPTGNTSPPVNVGSASQVKSGGLSIGSLIVSGGSIFGGNLQLSDNWLTNDGDSEGIYIDTAGSVGVGTAVPLGDLQIGDPDTSDGSTGQKLLQITGNGTGSPEGGEIRFQTAADYDTTYDSYAVDVYEDTFRVNRVGIGTDFVLDSAGNVGMGTAEPTAGLKLDVEGKVGATEYCDELGSNCFDASAIGGASAPVGGAGETNYIAVFSSSSTLATSSIFDNGTKVGIANAAPAGHTFQLTGTSLLSSTMYVGSTIYSYTGSDYFGFHHNGSLGTIFTTVASTNKDIQIAPGEAVAITVKDGGDVGVGTTGPGEKLEVNGNVLAAAYLYSSDERLKKNIKAYEGGSQVISLLNPVSYDWKNEDKGSDIGLLAQEVQKVYPSAVHEGKNGYLSIDYARLITPLISAMKEQQKEIENLKKEIRELKIK